MIRDAFGIDIVDEPAKANSTRGLANVEERRFPDSATDSDLERHQTQSILGREGGDDEVEGRLDDTVLEIRNADGDVGWGNGDDEDEVQWRVTEGGEGIGGTAWKVGGDQGYGDGSAIPGRFIVFFEGGEAMLLGVLSFEGLIDGT